MCESSSGSRTGTAPRLPMHFLPRLGEGHSRTRRVAARARPGMGTAAPGRGSTQANRASASARSRMRGSAAELRRDASSSGDMASATQSAARG